MPHQVLQGASLETKQTSKVLASTTRTAGFWDLYMNPSFNFQEVFLSNVSAENWRHRSVPRCPLRVLSCIAIVPLNTSFKQNHRCDRSPNRQNRHKRALAPPRKTRPRRMQHNWPKWGGYVNSIHFPACSFRAGSDTNPTFCKLVSSWLKSGKNHKISGIPVAAPVFRYSTGKTGRVGKYVKR